LGSGIGQHQGHLAASGERGCYFRAVNSILQLTHTSIGFILNKGKSNEDDSEIVRVNATATDGPDPIFEIVRVFLYI